jgi:hypothetical protein
MSKPPKSPRQQVSPELMREFITDDFEILLAVLNVPTTPKAVQRVFTVMVGVMAARLIQLGVGRRKIAGLAREAVLREEAPIAAEASSPPRPTRPDRGI